MVNRIKQLMAYKGLSSTQLADTIEVPRAVISHILSERNKPSLDVVLKIVNRYRDISMSWLLLSEGDMLMSLASEPKPLPVAAPVAQVLPAADPAAPPVPEAIDKVQFHVPDETLAKASDKPIEQIMVFYSDKTFAVYKPS